MKILISLCLFSYVAAEAPLPDSYASARNNDVEVQKSLSFDYGAPEFGSRSNLPSSGLGISSTYGPPSRSSYRGSPASTSFQTYNHGNSRALSRGYNAPSSRNSLSQVYGAPNTRSGPSQIYGAPSLRNTVSQVYGTPNSRNAISQEYGVPGVRNSLSQEYGPPVLSNSISQEYGSPAFTNSISQEYGTPSTRNSLSQNYGLPLTSQDYSSASSRGLSQQYGVPAFRNDLSTSYGVPRTGISDSYGTPLQKSSNLYNAPGFDPIPSEEYGVPTRNLDVGSDKHSSYQNPSNSIPDDYTVPSMRFNTRSSYSRNTGSYLGSQQSLSTQYGAPSARSSHSGFKSSYNPQRTSTSYVAPKSLTTEYGAPEIRSDLKTGAYAAAFGSARASPSQSYGVPSRSSTPSEQYGVPDLHNSLSNQGYGYARNALDELLNQEPANYGFGYKVNDYQSGSDFGHTETRQENKAEGSYFVVLPDGTKQIVEYEADERGFKPRISVEPVETGYDDNASDLARSGDGPY